MCAFLWKGEDENIEYRWMEVNNIIPEVLVAITNKTQAELSL